MSWGRKDQLLLHMFTIEPQIWGIILPVGSYRESRWLNFRKCVEPLGNRSVSIADHLVRRPSFGGLPLNSLFQPSLLPTYRLQPRLLRALSRVVHMINTLSLVLLRREHLSLER